MPAGLRTTRRAGAGGPSPMRALRASPVRSRYWKAVAPCERSAAWRTRASTQGKTESGLPMGGGSIACSGDDARHRVREGLLHHDLVGPEAIECPKDLECPGGWVGDSDAPVGLEFARRAPGLPVVRGSH